MNKDIIIQSRILIIDDNQSNVLLLERILQQSGYQHYESLIDSRQIIARFRDFQPDVILLDLMMPHVDGFAVMRQLRGWIPDSDYLPILVITADTSRTTRQKALTLGAKDFLTKPVDNAEACARIYNLLETRWLHREIQAQNKILLQYNGGLEKVVQNRTRELTEAQQRLSILDKAKSDFLRLIAHELRTPLNGLLGTAELILDLLEPDPESDELRDMYTQSRRRVLTMLDNALLLTQIEMEGEKFATVAISLSAALGQAIDQTSAFAGARQVRLQPPVEDSGLILQGSPLLSRALQAVLETAVKFARPREEVVIRFEEDASEVVLIIQTESGTLPQGAIDDFFSLLAISEASTSAGDLGFGPALAQRIISLFGGSVAVRTRQLTGIELRISFPRTLLCSAETQQPAVLADAGTKTYVDAARHA